MNAIILAGGKAKRFNSLNNKYPKEDIFHKSFLRIEDKTIIERQLSILKNIFEEVIIVTNNFDLYKDFDTKLVSDIMPNKGSLGGIYSGLFHSNSFYNFVFACDMPFLNRDLIKYMMENSKDYDVVIPRIFGKLEPLYAIYSKRCLDAIKLQIEDNDLKISHIFPEARARIITEDEIKKSDSTGLSFVNINTRKDYEFIRLRLNTTAVRP